MQIKYITLGLLVAAVTSQARPTELAEVHDTKVTAHDTVSGILNGVNIKDILNNANVNVASGKHGLSRRKVPCPHCLTIARRNGFEADENEADENEADENEADEDEADEDEADENEVNESR